MPTDPSTIHSYDEHAAEWAKRMKSKKSATYFHLEKPAMLSALPALEDKDVLCLGCGSGEECQMLKDRGAARVVGIDISKGLIEQARYAFPEIEFQVMDMERLTFEESSFDFVYSSLAVHYLDDWQPLLSGVKKVLRPGGKFLFSTHHPIRFAAESTKTGDLNKSILGYEMKDDSKEFVVHGDYLNARPIQDTWFDKVKVTYYHKPFAGIINEVMKSGLALTAVIEPKSAESAKSTKPQFYEINQKIPLFLILELTKQ